MGFYRLQNKLSNSLANEKSFGIWFDNIEHISNKKIIYVFSHKQLVLVAAPIFIGANFFNDL